MFKRFVVSCSLCLLSFASLGDVPLFSGAEYLGPTTTEEVQFWPLALAKVRKIDGDYIFEKEQHIDGTISQTSYHIRGERTLYDITRFYQSYANAGDKEILFFCQGRACGPSNYWANTYFGVRELNGPDTNQRLWVLKKGEQYQLVYLIERGNRRIYLHVVDVVEKQS